MGRNEPILERGTETKSLGQRSCFYMQRKKTITSWLWHINRKIKGKREGAVTEQKTRPLGAALQQRLHGPCQVRQPVDPQLPARPLIFRQRQAVGTSGFQWEDGHRQLLYFAQGCSRQAHVVTGLPSRRIAACGRFSSKSSGS